MDPLSLVKWRPSSVELNQVHTIGNGRRSVDDLGQFITLSVHLCVQDDAREAAHRAGPSATADFSLLCFTVLMACA